MKKHFTDLGNIVMTKEVAKLKKENCHFDKFIKECLVRYGNCDWGNLSTEDIHTNNNALEHGERILASYNFPEGDTFNHSDGRLWIITEWNRRATTILFPSEY